MSKNNAERDGILVKVRLDFRARGRDRSFLFKGKHTERAAEDARERQTSLFRNIPVQGAEIIDIDAGTEVYIVYDEAAHTEVAYAPLILTIKADNVESLLKFIARDEFRKIEVLDPASLTLSHTEIERILFRFFEETQELRAMLERKYN